MEAVIRRHKRFHVLQAFPLLLCILALLRQNSPRYRPYASICDLKTSGSCRSGQSAAAVVRRWVCQVPIPASCDVDKLGAKEVTPRVEGSDPASQWILPHCSHVKG